METAGGVPAVRAESGRRARAARVARAVTAVGLASAAIFLSPQRAAAERHVAAASGHMCVVTAGDAVVCVGNDFVGASLKTHVTAGVPFVAVTAGDDYSCGLAVNGSALCWGELPGDAPPLGVTFIDIHGGPRHVCGLQTDGTVLCYGNATAGVTSNVPAVAFQGVSTGTDYACGVGRDKSVACWGDATNPVVASAPVITDAEHVATGARHACYVRVGGSVGCWGDNTEGQATPPAHLAVGGAVWWLAAGEGITCAMSGITAPGAVECWGRRAHTVVGMGAYEVACAGWGCIASAVDNGGVVSTAFPAAALGGVPLPQTYYSHRTFGQSTRGFADGIGTNALFDRPQAMVMDGTGDTLYVVDKYNDVIRRANLTDLNVTTVAGSTYGYLDSPDPRTAKFQHPNAIDFDAAGNLYIADASNFVVRQMAASGAVTTVAGRRISGYEDGVGTNVKFGELRGMKCDRASGMVFLADRDAQALRAVAPNGTVYTVAAAIGSAIFDGPISVALVPAAPFMYVGTTTAIVKVTYDGRVTRFVGNSAAGYVDGVGSAAQFSSPSTIALDRVDNLYVVDTDSYRIRKVSPAGVVVTVVGKLWGGIESDGFGTNAVFDFIMGYMVLDLPRSKMYVVDAGGGSQGIREVDITVSPPPVPVGISAAPLPPSPLAPSHQVAAWRALAVDGARALTAPGLDTRTATFAAPLAAANTAGMNPAINRVLLGDVALAPRDSAPGAADATFSTSARRGVRDLTLTTAALPFFSLALPSLTTLSLGSPAGALLIGDASFAAMPVLSCINCYGATGLANLSTLGVSSSNVAGNLSALGTTGLFSIPVLTALDLSNNGLAVINEHDFDGAIHLLTLSLAHNPALATIHCATFTTVKQPALVASAVDETGNPPSNWRAGCPSPPPLVSATPTSSVTPTSTGSGTPTSSGTPSNTGTPASFPSVSGTPPPILGGNLGSGTSESKPDVLPAALTVAVIAVVLIVGLLVCRGGPCCAFCCGAARRSDKGEATGGDRRTGMVIKVVGTDSASSHVAARPASPSAITVNTAGGGFVLYAGAERGVAV